MKHVANAMQFNERSINQESTIGQIFETGRGKSKKFIVKQVYGGLAREFKTYLEACQAIINANDTTFVRPV
jgi:hypothetical protein|nr:MAG TPA: hypothetical protein [Caudoviricetes sp.]